MNGWQYETRAKAVEQFQREQYAETMALRQATPSYSRPMPEGLNLSQIDLFQINPEDFDYANAFIAGMPDFLARYFVRRYKKTFQQQGRMMANRWIRQTMQGTTKNPNQGILARIEGVMSQYPNAQRINLAKRNVIVEQGGKITRLRNSKGIEEFSRLEVEAFAREASGEILQLFYEFKEKYLDAVLTDEQIDKLMKSLYHKLAYRTQQYGINAPEWDKFQNDKLSNTARDVAMAKMLCEKWWDRKLWRLRNQMREHLAIAVGQVQKGASPYISREGLSRWKEQKRKNLDFINQMLLINEDDEEEQIELKEMFYKTVSNPAIRRCELMVRMRGFEELAKRMDYVGEFYTLTAPSAYHASKTGGFNGKWNFSNPKSTQKYLCNVWGKVRASLARQKIRIFGFRVVEPHHDGTPHWHMLFFMEKANVEKVRATISRYALEIDGEEVGAKEHRFTVKPIEEEKGSATGYIAKYIAKNIDGYAMDDEIDEETGEKCKDSASKITAWASQWRIRQFQQIGGSPITVWRELRRLKGESIADDPELTALIKACDQGEWDKYTELQGGAFVKRADVLARVKYEEREPNSYGETSQKIVGVYNQHRLENDFIGTHLTKWKLVKKPTNSEGTNKNATQPQGVDLADYCVRSTPWNSVNNCTQYKKHTTEDFLKIHVNEVKKLDFALKIRGIPSRWITDERKKRLIQGKAISFKGYESLVYNGAEISIVQNP